MPVDLPTARRLIAEAREDDERMTKAPWRADGVDIFTITDSSGQGFPLDRYPDSVDVVVGNCDGCGNRGVGVQRAGDELAIARTRNNLAAMAEQLELALAEVARMRPVYEAAIHERRMERELGRVVVPCKVCLQGGPDDVCKEHRLQYDAWGDAQNELERVSDDARHAIDTTRGPKPRAVEVDPMTPARSKESPGRLKG